VDILVDEVMKLNRNGYHFIDADVTQMDLDILADTIVAGELIEHIDNPGLMLESAQQHLKPGGRIILTTPNPWAMVHLRSWLTGNMSINRRHVAWYGPLVLRELLERHNFQVVTINPTNRDHKGLTGLAQKLGSDIFGSTTWVCVAKKPE
jgi:2-polyprenyl-3-methyl-5-hydroxy-6-metoxy-1,4-benzoquinol methylase